MPINTNDQLRKYVRDCVYKSGSHHAYERHKRFIDILCGGNTWLYEKWIKKVVRKMGI